MSERSSWRTWLILIVLAVLIAGAIYRGGGDWIWRRLLELHGMGAGRRP
jgi:hypothetical protein